MFAVPKWENEDAATEMAAYPLSEVTPASVHLPIRSQKDVKTFASSASGRIIRQGIKFDSFEEFCQFVDGGSKSKVLRKGKNSRQIDGRSPDSYDEQSTKKQKFNVEKLIDVLNEDKAETTSVNALSAMTKFSKSETKLRTSRFRYLNQQLYTQTGEASFKMFKKDPAAFKAYHEGYMEQASKWPDGDPLHNIIMDIMKQCKSTRLESPQIADFGCGEARLARSLPSMNVASLDLIAMSPNVTACDMANSPLNADSIDIVVFCLSLMGTNLKDYLYEANRVLKIGGIMKIAEVKSRFSNIGVDGFIATITEYGFQIICKTANDEDKSYFLFFDLKKIYNCRKKKKLPEVMLKPCIYKKR